MAHINITLNTEILQGLFSKSGRDDAFAKLLEEILNQVLQAQATEQLQAEPYERNGERQGYRNGFREREITTRVGSLTLAVPRLRNGSFSTELFERYQRSEQALVLAMMEMVVQGVSTRKVSAITEELCGKSFSKSTVSALCEALDPVVEAFRNRPLHKHYPFVIVDALYSKIREDGRVRSKGVLIATGVNEDGYREVLGFNIDDSESEQSWGDFFTSLKERGLEDVDLVVSDNHKGLVKAIHKQFINASWQRCQTHFSRNVSDKTPNKLKAEINERLQRLYNADDKAHAKQLLEQLVEDYAEKAPQAVNSIEEAFEDITAVIALPAKYRKRLRTTNSIERMNEEIRRRERVIRIFPNVDSAVRLIGAMLIEQHEKWTSSHKYFEMDEYYQFAKEEKSSNQSSSQQSQPSKHSIESVA
ncbi:MAG TPA: IS256 family transposase [Clostridiales bacterium]|jgi:putative transposase|nr:IS256 family transposase [Clostridiales bacterium]